MTVDAWAYGPDRFDLVRILDRIVSDVHADLNMHSYRMAHSVSLGIPVSDQSIVHFRVLDAKEGFFRRRLLSLWRSAAAF